MYGMMYLERGEIDSMASKTYTIIKDVNRILSETFKMLRYVSDRKYKGEKAEKIIVGILYKALRNKVSTGKITITPEDILAILVSERVKMKPDMLSIKRTINQYLSKIRRIIETKTSEDLAIALAYMRTKHFVKIV